MAGLNPGDEIICSECGAVVWVAVERVEPHSEILSKNFAYPDGTPLPYGAMKICGECSCTFGSFSMETKKTTYLRKYDFDPDMLVGPGLWQKCTPCGCGHKIVSGKTGKCRNCGEKRSKPRDLTWPKMEE